MGKIAKNADHVDVEFGLEDIFKDRSWIWRELYRFGWHMLRVKAPQIAKKTLHGTLLFTNGKVVARFFFTAKEPKSNEN
jgi:hypothetical protein